MPKIRGEKPGEAHCLPAKARPHFGRTNERYPGYHSTPSPSPSRFYNTIARLTLMLTQSTFKKRLYLIIDSLGLLAESLVLIAPAGD